MPIVRSDITNMSATASYWCYRCTRFITISPETTFVCPHCHGGFIEAVDSSRRIRRRRHLFNPVIVLRSPSHETQHSRTFDLYYDDGAGSGLRRVPAPISEFLMVSGFDRLLEHLSQIGLARPENPPASKAAIESIPTVEINHSHVSAESHCAVCMEQFEFGSEAREMPCQHIYHPECILPWLSLRNSCPVCRHELPADNSQSEDPTEGLTIWRLPGGGFAVGRFTGGRRGVGSELPAVYTEMDGGFNDGGAPRRVVSGSRRSTGGLGRAFRSFISFLRRFRSGSSSESSRPSINRSQSHLGLVSSSLARRRSRAWVVEEGNGISGW